MKRFKVFGILSFMLVFVLVVSACAKKEDKSSYDVSYGSTASTEESAPMAPEYGYDENKDKATGDDFAYATDEAKGELSATSALTSQENLSKSNDKIIRRFNLDVETEGFDSLIKKIDSEINRLGGYIENSQISGKSYYYEHQARSGRIIARVPRDKVDEFVNSVNEEANVVNKQESTENVTLQYVDIESRKQTLEIEQERLFALLEKTDTLDNIIILENRLSEIRYELQSYETQLRTYDNQVDYSTVTLNVQEVERITPVSEVKQSVGDRIKNGFSDTIFNISEGFKNFFVWFVVNMPYLIIWAVIILAIILFIRRLNRKSRRKDDNQPDLNQQGKNGQNGNNQS